MRTAPRDALVADSIAPAQRGLAFGFHRAADTAGAVLGLAVALLVVWLAQAGNVGLTAGTFRTLVLISLIPAALAVGFVVGVIWAVMHPDQTVEEMQKSLTFPAIGAELAIVAIYIAVAVIWEKSIKRKAGAGR